MKALLINVENQTVSEINLEKTNEDIYKHIGNGCSTFCSPVDFPNGDSLFVDDEGLLKEDLKGCFTLLGWVMPLVGNAVIIGSTPSGDSTDCKTTKEEILSQILWGNKEVADSHRDIAMKSPFTIISTSWEE